MIIPWVRVVWLSDEKGYGLIATQFIPKGTVTFVQDGLDIVIPSSDLESIDPRLLEYVEKYSYEDFLGNRIISWDLGKYMNHDDQANTLTTAYGFEVSVRDIEPGEEVTDDYRIFSTHHDTNTWHMGPKKTKLEPWPEKLLASWNKSVEEALAYIDKVKQPLKGFIPSKTWETVLSGDQTKCVSEAFPLRYKNQTNGLIKKEL
jgi:hypothetical protein